jgi:hypothetical protein
MTWRGVVGVKFPDVLDRKRLLLDSLEAASVFAAELIRSVLSRFVDRAMS